VAHHASLGMPAFLALVAFVLVPPSAVSSQEQTFLCVTDAAVGFQDVHVGAMVPDPEHKRFLLRYMPAEVSPYVRGDTIIVPEHLTSEVFYEPYYPSGQIRPVRYRPGEDATERLVTTVGGLRIGLDDSFAEKGIRVDPNPRGVYVSSLGTEYFWLTGGEDDGEQTLDFTHHFRGPPGSSAHYTKAYLLRGRCDRVGSPG